jgi:GTP cyclohydrolase I
VQWRQLERHASEILQMMGMRLDSPATRATPRRFIRALFDATDGYEGDSKLVTVWRGAYELNEALRAEFLATCQTAVGPRAANG